jgi:hypothetical protein
MKVFIGIVVGYWAVATITKKTRQVAIDKAIHATIKSI